MDLVKFLVFIQILKEGLTFHLEMYPMKMNWYLAQQFCQIQGGHLVSPNSSKIQSEMVKQVNEYSITHG